MTPEQKAEELKKSNWVLQNTGVFKKMLQVSVKDILHIDSGSMKAEPVELTPELLLKCGFESERYSFNNCVYKQIDNYGTYLLGNKDGVIITKPFADCGDVFPNFDMGIEIKFLHHLQNVYYTLSGQELEVKF